MKRCALILLSILLIPGYIHGDVLPEDSHGVQRQVFITNVTEFPQIQLIGYITGPMILRYQIQVIEEGVPLSKGYKFNDFKIVAINDEAIESSGGIENIAFDLLAQKMPMANIIDPFGGYVSNDNPLVAESYYYRVTEVTEKSLVLRLDRKVLRYNNGDPDRIVNY